MRIIQKAIYSLQIPCYQGISHRDRIAHDCVLHHTLTLSVDPLPTGRP